MRDGRKDRDEGDNRDGRGNHTDGRDGRGNTQTIGMCDRAGYSILQYIHLARSSCVAFHLLKGLSQQFESG